MQIAIAIAIAAVIGGATGAGTTALAITHSGPSICPAEVTRPVLPWGPDIPTTGSKGF